MDSVSEMISNGKIFSIHVKDNTQAKNVQSWAFDNGFLWDYQLAHDKKKVYHHLIGEGFIIFESAKRVLFTYMGQNPSDNDTGTLISYRQFQCNLLYNEL
jgi:hypothetical protein